MCVLYVCVWQGGGGGGGKRAERWDRDVKWWGERSSEEKRSEEIGVIRGVRRWDEERSTEWWKGEMEEVRGEKWIMNYKGAVQDWSRGGEEGRGRGEEWGRREEGERGEERERRRKEEGRREGERKRGGERERENKKGGVRKRERVKKSREEMNGEERDIKIGGGGRENQGRNKETGHKSICTLYLPSSRTCELLQQRS